MAKAAGRWLLLVALVLVTAWVYAPAGSAGWVWCDDYVLADEARLGSIRGLLELWARGNGEQYTPATWTAWFVIGECFGRDPEVFHRFTISLHALAALLLARWMQPFGVLVATLSTALYALHPLQVESVAWVYETKTTLCAVLMLAAALGHRRAVRSHSKTWNLASLTVFLAALLAKPSAIVLPAWLALIAWAEHLEGRTTYARRAWRSTVPFFLLALVAGLFTLFHESSVTGAQHPIGLMDRPALVPRLWAWYVQRWCWPLDLSFARGPLAPWNAMSSVGAVLVAVGTAMVVGLAVRGSPLARRLGVALGMISVAILPVSGLWPIYMFRYTLVADHLAANLTLVAAPLTALSIAVWWKGGRLRRCTAAVLVSAAMVMIARESHELAGLYRSERALFEHSLAKGERSWLAHVRLALLDRGDGRPFTALAHLREALQIERTVDAWVNAANLHREVGRPQIALRCLEEAGESLDSVDSLERLQERAGALASAGALELARDTYRKILEKDPQNTLAADNERSLDAVIVKFAREIERLRDTPEPEPRSARSARLSRMASLATTIGDRRLALECLTPLEDAASQRERARILLCAEDPQLRDPRTARRTLWELAVNPAERDPDLFELLAEAAAADGDVQDADRWFQELENWSATADPTLAAWIAERRRWVMARLALLGRRLAFEGWLEAEPSDR